MHLERGGIPTQKCSCGESISNVQLTIINENYRWEIYSSERTLNCSLLHLKKTM